MRPSKQIARSNGVRLTGARASNFVRYFARPFSAKKIRTTIHIWRTWHSRTTKTTRVTSTTIIIINTVCCYCNFTFEHVTSWHFASPFSLSCRCRAIASTPLLRVNNNRKRIAQPKLTVVCFLVRIYKHWRARTRLHRINKEPRINNGVNALGNRTFAFKSSLWWCARSSEYKAHEKRLRDAVAYFARTPCIIGILFFPLELSLSNARTCCSRKPTHCNNSSKGRLLQHKYEPVLPETQRPASVRFYL